MGTCAANPPPGPSLGGRGILLGGAFYGDGRAACGRQDAVGEIFGGVEAVPRADCLGGALAHRAPIVAVVPGALQNFVQQLGGSCRGDKAGFVIVDQLSDAANIRRDCNAAADHRLDERERVSFGS